MGYSCCPLRAIPEKKLGTSWGGSLLKLGGGGGGGGGVFHLGGGGGFKRFSIWSEGWGFTDWYFHSGVGVGVRYIFYSFEKKNYIYFFHERISLIWVFNLSWLQSDQAEVQHYT